MASQSFLEPVPSREPVTQRDTLVLTPVYVRWLDAVRQLQLSLPGTYQPLDATLSALAALVGTADTLPYFTGTEVAALTPLTPFARTLLDDATAAAMRATLGLMLGVQQTQVTVNATNGAAQLTAAGLAPVGSRLLAVTTSITTAFSTANGLSALLLGDTVAVDRWGRQTALTAGAVTSAGDMRSDTLPLVRTAPYSALIAAEGGTFGATGTMVVTATYATVA
jgi:hypothetical protein